MTTLLYITAHPLTKHQSRSLNLGMIFINAYQQSHPYDEIIELDLFALEVPEINKTTLNAWNKLRKGVPLNNLTGNEQQLLKRHDELCSQFVNADKYVFVNPMWNHFLPPILKSYLDTLCIAGKTFRYTAQGPIGLLKNKKAIHIQAAGGIYDRKSEITDFGHAYLAHIMNFFGIMDIESLFVEGMDAQPNLASSILTKAADRATLLANSF